MRVREEIGEAASGGCVGPVEDGQGRQEAAWAPSEEEGMIPVLDRGYVRLVDHMGTDLTVVNAARCSYAKESSLGPSGLMDNKDVRLIHYLVSHGHTTPLRHCFCTFEVKAPLMVARQWWRYVVGSDHTMDGWNEQSRRYVTAEPEFYVPTEWRGKSTKDKQGSDLPLGYTDSCELDEWMRDAISTGVASYEAALEMGVTPEQARLFLPAYAMYTTWRWSASLQSVTHFLKERLDEHAQWEIRQYATAVRCLVTPRFPETIAAVLGEID